MAGKGSVEAGEGWTNSAGSVSRDKSSAESRALTPDTVLGELLGVKEPSSFPPSMLGMEDRPDPASEKYEYSDAGESRPERPDDAGSEDGLEPWTDSREQSESGADRRTDASDGPGVRGHPSAESAGALAGSKSSRMFQGKPKEDGRW